MRVVLRVEVEAVKFLKEEPHRLDALLKRCSTMSDALSMLRRYEYQTRLTSSRSHSLLLVKQRRRLLRLIPTYEAPGRGTEQPAPPSAGAGCSV